MLFLVFLVVFFSSKGAIHAGIVGVWPGSVGRTKGTGLMSAYCFAVRTMPRCLFWPPPWGLLIDTALSVRRRWLSQMAAYFGPPGCLGRDRDGNPLMVALTERVCSIVSCSLVDDF